VVVVLGIMRVGGIFDCPVYGVYPQDELLCAWDLHRRSEVLTGGRGQGKRKNKCQRYGGSCEGLGASRRRFGTGFPTTG